MEDGVPVGKIITGICLGMVLLLVGFLGGCPPYYRYQARADAENQTILNEIKIHQVAQLVEVEKQKAEIRVAEANGISRSQEIINATLTDKYLQHEAIVSQRDMANSPNHTTIYIPSGQNGIPLVKTTE
jgi:hypothetical protein